MPKLPISTISSPLVLAGGFVLGIIFMAFIAGPLFSFFDSNTKCQEYLVSRGLASYSNPAGQSLVLKSGSCKFEETPVGKYTSGKVDFSFVLGDQEGLYHFEWSPGLPGTSVEKITIPAFQTTNKELFEIVRSNKCGYFSYLASYYNAAPDLQSRYSSAASTCLGFNASAEDSMGVFPLPPRTGLPTSLPLNKVLFSPVF